MPNLTVTEIKAFVPARDFSLSRQFYQDLGFTLASDGDGVAYFHFGASLLLPWILWCWLNTGPI